MAPAETKPKRNRLTLSDFNQVSLNIITFKAMCNLREFDLSRPLWVVLSIITVNIKYFLPPQRKLWAGNVDKRVGPM